MADVRIDEHNVYAPDLLWLSTEHLPADLDAYPERIPDLCVEIRSHSTWRYDIGAKQRVYEATGLPELWLVDDAAESVLVYRRTTPRRGWVMHKWRIGSGAGAKRHSCTIVMREWRMPKATASMRQLRRLHRALSETSANVLPRPPAQSATG
jgi:hypothetical protein